MEKIRYYQLRMMEQPIESTERKVYRDLIRQLILQQETTLSQSL